MTSLNRKLVAGDQFRFSSNSLPAVKQGEDYGLAFGEWTGWHGDNYHVSGHHDEPDRLAKLDSKSPVNQLLSPSSGTKRSSRSSSGSLKPSSRSSSSGSSKSGSSSSSSNSNSASSSSGTSKSGSNSRVSSKPLMKDARKPGAHKSSEWKCVEMQQHGALSRNI